MASEPRRTQAIIQTAIEAAKSAIVSVREAEGPPKAVDQCKQHHKQVSDKLRVLSEKFKPQHNKTI